MVPSYIRRAAEIEIALMADWIYIKHKSTQNVIDFFKKAAVVLNLSDFELVETAIINYKRLMPTPNELTAISDLAKSRSKFIKSDIISNKMCRKTFYATLKETPRIDMTLFPKTKTPVTDAIMKFLDAYEHLVTSFANISLFCYNLEQYVV